MIDLSQLIEDVNEEVESPYKALHYLKELQKEIKKTIEIIEPISFEIAKYEDKNFTNGDFKIEKRNGKKNFNFKKCKSFVIANNNLDEIKNDLKANFSLFEKGKQSIDEDGVIGEIPEVTYSKDSLIIKKI